MEIYGGLALLLVMKSNHMKSNLIIAISQWYQQDFDLIDFIIQPWWQCIINLHHSTAKSRKVLNPKMGKCILHNFAPVTAIFWIKVLNPNWKFGKNIVIISDIFYRTYLIIHVQVPHYILGANKFLHFCIRKQEIIAWLRYCKSIILHD